MIVCAHDPASYSACAAEPTSPGCTSQPALTSEPTVFTIAADGSRVRRFVPPSVPRIAEGAECGVALGVCEDGLTCEAEGDVRRCRAFEWPTLEEAACENGGLDVTETDVDCGGPCFACDLGERCEVSADCASAACEAGLCVEPGMQDAACENGMLDETETDIDCGGDCLPCGVDERCEVNVDCASGACEAGRCAATTFACGDAECALGTSYCRVISETDRECVDTPPDCASCACVPADVAGCACFEEDGALYVDCTLM